MKNYNYLIVLFLMVFSSCSSDDDAPIVDDTPAVNSLEFSVNGTVVFTGTPNLYTKAMKANHHIHLGTDAADTDFLVSFDENGNFGKVVYEYVEPLTLVHKLFTSYANNSSHYFNFHLESYDQAHKRVKVSFDGYLYRNPLDLTSESKFVNGSFDLPYEEYTTTYANFISEATINGNYWRGTNRYQTKTGNIVTTNSLSNNEYKVMIAFNVSTWGVPSSGTYAFTPASTENKVQIAKFDVTTGNYITYNCTGTLNFDRWDFRIMGTYSLTGVNPANPSDIITVQNGNFKLPFSPYN